MKPLKLSAAAATLGGMLALVVGSAPSVYGQSRGRELTILSGRGGQLGVSIVDGQSGVEVEEVQADSAAEKAGLKRGDIIIEFDGEHVRSTRQLSRLVQETPPGRNVKATIARDGKNQDVQVTLTEGRDSRVIVGDLMNRLPEIERQLQGMPYFNYRFDLPGAMTGGRLGVTVTELTSQLATYFGARDGVLVTSVAEGSAAEKAGIKAGDIITSVDGQQVTSSADLIQGVRRTDTEELSIGIVRDKKELTLKAKIEAPRRTPRSARPV